MIVFKWWEDDSPNKHPSIRYVPFCQVFRPEVTFEGIDEGVSAFSIELSDLFSVNEVIIYSPRSEDLENYVLIKCGWLQVSYCCLLSSEIPYNIGIMD